MNGFDAETVPLDGKHLTSLLERAPRAVSIEEAVLDGGVGSALGDLIHDERIATELLRLGVPCSFVEPGSNVELCQAYGLDADGLVESVLSHWPELGRVGR